MLAGHLIRGLGYMASWGLILAALHPKRGGLVTRGVMDRGLSAMARAGLAGHVGACPFVIARIGALILSLPDIERLPS